MTPNDSVFATIAAPLYTKHGASFIKIRDGSHDNILLQYLYAQIKNIFFPRREGKVAEEMFYVCLPGEGRPSPTPKKYNVCLHVECFLKVP